MAQRRGPKVHVLSDVDVVAHTATCAACGPVRVQRRPRANGQVGWACREARKQRRAANPRAWAGPRTADYSPVVRRQRTYGLTPEQYDAMLAAQGGLCAICRRDRVLVVDHDHATGAVRGLLCTPCNTGLGLFLDAPAALLQAAAYLEQRRASV